jgi:hypothetical protein
MSKLQSFVILHEAVYIVKSLIFKLMRTLKYINKLSFKYSICDTTDINTVFDNGLPVPREIILYFDPDVKDSYIRTLIHYRYTACLRRIK